ncbi:hypothetical protein EVAR_69951_1, partial [Eumeta japonica]
VAQPTPTWLRLIPTWFLSMSRPSAKAFTSSQKRHALFTRLASTGADV